jgi:hypothetical protein
MCLMCATLVMRAPSWFRHTPALPIHRTPAAASPVPCSAAPPSYIDAGRICVGAGAGVRALRWPPGAEPPLR